MAEIGDIVVLGNDEAVPTLGPTSDRTVNLRDHSAFVESQVAVAVGHGYDLCVAVRTGVQEPAPVRAIGDVGHEVVWFPNLLERTLQCIVVVGCDAEGEKPG